MFSEGHNNGIIEGIPIDCPRRNIVDSRPCFIFARPTTSGYLYLDSNTSIIPMLANYPGKGPPKHRYYDVNRAEKCNISCIAIIACADTNTILREGRESTIFRLGRSAFDDTIIMCVKTVLCMKYVGHKCNTPVKAEAC